MTFLCSGITKNFNLPTYAKLSHPSGEALTDPVLI